MLLLKILGGLGALALGIWLGLPGRYAQDLSDIEERLDQPGSRTRERARRHFTPLAWVQRRAKAPDARGRRRIRMVSPDEDDASVDRQLWKSV